MTIVIGIHGGDFVLIGADTRSMQLNNDGVNWDIDDTVEKVFPTGVGVMSGAGHLAAIQLTEVRMRLAVQSTELADSIADAIEDIRQHLPEQADGARQVTHLMQSYVDVGGGMVLATVGPEDDYVEHRVAAYEHALFAPHGMPQPIQDALNTQIRGAIAAALRNAQDPWNVRAEHAARIIQTAFHFTGARLNTVSPRTFQLGLLDATPRMRVCDITEDIARVRWRDAVEPHVPDDD